MNTRINSILLMALALLIGQTIFGQTSAKTGKWLNKVEKAHGMDVLTEKAALSFELQLVFGGKERFNGKVTTLTNSGQIKLERQDGTILVFDGQELWQYPADAEWKGARFDAFTWQYFFMAPYKLQDPGTQWTEKTTRRLMDDKYASARLSFKDGTGDAPDDWYIAYVDRNTHLLTSLAYIVTYGGRSANEATPHAITYEDFRSVDGVHFAHEWKFWDWEEEAGLGKQLGSATIKNIQFQPAESLRLMDKANAKQITD